ncbi:metallophosphoesterase [Clostridium aestuarii]|uniref:Metallophosphoesterase n=1 Tax=Clostridium aestuarii TaxID=338193 RepID=A0ABT4CVD7_9CLOT|nr:metallophosphoesterase [Clostridium aestuarii]MCY6482934.1 metallophosphoesterase [Clostridium aestuarii]
MKILAVSDKESRYIWDHFDAERFKDIDLIISSGDLKASYLSFLVTMIKAPLFYVPGNHDENYLKRPPEGCVNIDNKLVTYKNIRILGLGGSKSYCGGAFQYTERQIKNKVFKTKFKIVKNRGFDILVTHSPARGLGDGEDFCHRGFEAFNILLDKYKPKYYIHGHQHLNYGNQNRIIQYNSSTIINAYNYYIFEY